MVLLHADTTLEFVEHLVNLRVDGLQRMSADEHAQVLKLLAKRHRDLDQLKSKAACRLHALLMELPPGGMAEEMT